MWIDCPNIGTPGKCYMNVRITHNIDKINIPIIILIFGVCAYYHKINKS